MALDFNGSTHYLAASSVPVAAEPLSMGCWFNADNTTAGLNAMSLGANAASGHWRLGLLGNVSGDPVSAAKQSDAGGNARADTSAGYSSGTWNHGLAVFASATSRTAYLNGANAGTNTDNLADPTAAFTGIGALVRAANSLFMDGKLAECAIWNVALTAADALMLAAGYSPLFVRPANLVLYTLTPHRTGSGAAADLVGGLTLTSAATPARFDHPRIIYPRQVWPRFVNAAAPASSILPFVNHYMAA